jgi:hypothetical protein
MKPSLMIGKQLELLHAELNAIECWDRAYLKAKVCDDIDDHSFIARGLRLMEIGRELEVLDRAANSLQAKFAQVVDLRTRTSTRLSNTA